MTLGQADALPPEAGLKVAPIGWFVANPGHSAIAAICHGPWTLVNAQLARGRRTAFCRPQFADSGGQHVAAAFSSRFQSEGITAEKRGRRFLGQ